MKNPFIDAAEEVKANYNKIDADERAARDAAEASRKAQAEAYQTAVVLFERRDARIAQCVRLANEAVSTGDLTVKMSKKDLNRTEPGSFEISLSAFGKKQASFRVVANASFKVFVHELDNPKFGPFDLNDVDALPFDEIFTSFLQSAAGALKKN